MSFAACEEAPIEIEPEVRLEYQAMGGIYSCQLERIKSWRVYQNPSSFTVKKEKELLEDKSLLISFGSQEDKEIRLWSDSLTDGNTTSLFLWQVSFFHRADTVEKKMFEFLNTVEDKSLWLIWYSDNTDTINLRQYWKVDSAGTEISYSMRWAGSRMQ
ncbi:MAG: hypothetical protein AAFQ87_15225 [Bacteroidota bacterium]